jgi:hypothetical protein
LTAGKDRNAETAGTVSARGVLTMKRNRFFGKTKIRAFLFGMFSAALTLGLVLAGCVTDGGDDPAGTLDSLLSGASSEIQIWDEGNENERAVTVYSLNPEIKDELFQAVKDAGFFQTWSGEYTRDWELEKGVLRWCVPSNIERWNCEIQFSAIGETTVHNYGFKLISIPNSDGRPKTIKITGYSSQGITAEAMLIFSESAGVDAWPPAAIAVEKINGQTITYNLGIWLGRWDNLESWTGTGKFFIVIECSPPKESGDGSKYVYSADGANATPVNITDEVTTLEWSKFIWLRDYTAG